MQIASILSDLTSLRVCDHSAAFVLVSVYEGFDEVSSTKDEHVGALLESGENIDIRRAYDLVDLHRDVKMKHAQGNDGGLEQAKRDVDRILRKLNNSNKRDSDGLERHTNSAF